MNDIKPVHVPNHVEEPKRTNRAFMSGMGGKPVTGYGGGAWCDRPFAVRFYPKVERKGLGIRRKSEIQNPADRNHAYYELLAGMCQVCGLAKDAKGAKHG